MFVISNSLEISSEEKSDLGIYAEWWYSETVPTKVDLIEGKKVFAVNNVEDRGEYYKRPEGAYGVIVLTLEKLAALAAWRNDEHKGPWPLYGEQEKGTTSFYFVGDTKIVFIGWV